MKVTSKPGRGEKVHIYIDGEYTATTCLTFWHNQRIYEGDDLTPEEVCELLQAIQDRRFFDQAVTYLSCRDYSRKELVEKLVAKAYRKKSEGLNSETFKESAEFACNRLEELGLLNEERFARSFAEELVRNKRISKRGLFQELSRKGVRREISELVIEEMDIDPEDSIRYLLETKYRNRDLNDEKDCRRTIRALQRLGYSFSEIKSVIENPFLENDE